jgi:hypothetical protein
MTQAQPPATHAEDALLTDDDKARHDFKNRRIIGSSGLTSMIGIARAADAGAAHFLPTPYRRNALLEVLQTALTPAAPPPESR